MRLAFVLLPAHVQLHAATIVEAYRRIFPNLRAPSPAGVESGEGCALEVEGDNVIIATMPAAVPNGEAEEVAQFSIGSFADDGALPPHVAHLIVTAGDAKGMRPADALMRFTRTLAAIVVAYDAVGVYWAASGATHPARFFVEVATDSSLSLPMFLWSGVSVAEAAGDRASLLSLGMSQLDLPELEVVAPRGAVGAALDLFFDLLKYVAGRGAVPAQGETVGRTAHEKLRVEHGRSPIHPDRKIWRVTLPATFRG